jgi:hypothetical protein
VFTLLDVWIEEALNNLNVIGNGNTTLSGEITSGKRIIESSDGDIRGKFCPSRVSKPQGNLKSKSLPEVPG